MRMMSFAALAAFVAWAGPAMAVYEPHQVGNDPRIRAATPETGEVVRLIAQRGKSLLVEFPAGYRVDTVLPSDQDVMVNAAPPDTGPIGRPMAPAAPPPAMTAADPENTCASAENLRYCVRRGRFLALMPLTPLDAQPLQVVLLKARPSGDPLEVTIVFQLETATADAYYSVRLEPPAPPAPPPRAAAPARPLTAPRRPARRYTVPAPAPQPAPPAVINQQYEVQGDRALVGEAR